MPDGYLHRAVNLIQQISTGEMYVAAIPYHHFFYCFALVMEHLKLFVARINIPKVRRVKHQGLSLIKFIEELFKC